MTLAAVLCTSGTIGATGIKSVYAAENEVQGRALITHLIRNTRNLFVISWDSGFIRMREM